MAITTALQMTLSGEDDVPPLASSVRGRRAAPLPPRRQGALFGVDELGAAVRAWTVAATATAATRCEMCGRRLRSAEARAAGVGPKCAAKRGRALVASVRLSRITRRRRHLQALVPSEP